MEELAAKGHQPSHIFRGAKADIFEGGHRIPFIVRWPGKIRPGSTNTQTVCLTDLLATCAELVGTALPPNAGEDRVSLLPAFLGKDTPPLREATVHHSINGSFAIRQANWKLIFCPGSGGWSKPKTRFPRREGLAAGATLQPGGGPRGNPQSPGGPAGADAAVDGLDGAVHCPGPQHAGTGATQRRSRRVI
jgi:hypothetical protein